VSLCLCRTLKYGGFDPLFWLHHAMIDRVLWLFQNNKGGWEVNAIGEQLLQPLDIAMLSCSAFFATGLLAKLVEHKLNLTAQ
jgi:hypothetical protein